MRLILGQYLRTLRERDEFDRLLPELLVAMGYVPLSKPQAGIRQFGVDFAAVGESPEDGVREMLLFVIKQGHIGRREWAASEPADLYPSLREVLDVYLGLHISKEHESLRKVVVVATTGDFKQEMTPNWKGFEEANKSRASFQLWHGDRVAALLEEYLLNENLFVAEDRHDLRKALALSGDRDYDFRDLCGLLRRQLGLDPDGNLLEPQTDRNRLLKAIQRANLAGQVCAHWAIAEGNSKHALWVSERALLWIWHRIQLSDPADHSILLGALGDSMALHQRIGGQYFKTMQGHFSVRDGMSGYCKENAEFSLVLFEHIGILATIGLSEITKSSAADCQGYDRASLYADALCALLENNDASASPRLDRHASEIALALSFLELTGRHQEATGWLEKLAYRLNYCFMSKRYFPIGNDSLDSLVDFEVSGLGADALMEASWMLSTIAAWCALLNLREPYELLAKGNREEYASVCGQLWHPTDDWGKGGSFKQMQFTSGDTEAPYTIPEDPSALLERIEKFLQLPRYNWLENSSTLKAGVWSIDFIACRHFQTPLPASYWYRLRRPIPQEQSADR